VFIVCVTKPIVSNCNSGCTKGYTKHPHGQILGSSTRSKKKAKAVPHHRLLLLQDSTIYLPEHPTVPVMLLLLLLSVIPYCFFFPYIFAPERLNKTTSEEKKQCASIDVRVAQRTKNHHVRLVCIR